MDQSNSITKYYNLENVYIIEKNMKRITKSNINKTGKDLINGSWTGSALNVYFFYPQKLIDAIKAEENEVTYSNLKNKLILKIKFPNQGDFENSKTYITIDKQNHTISKIVSKVDYFDQTQYKEWILSEIDFKSDKVNDLENLISKKYSEFTVRDFDETRPEPEPLPIKEKVPTISGFLYPDYNTQINTKFNKKVTILDFWYTSCMPCIEAIPKLNHLKQNFGDQIEIIGVNNVENKPKQKDKIQAFLKRTPIDYKILITDSVPEKYNIKAYPTLYLINQEGKVIYAAEGYNDNLYEKLEKIIQDNL